MFGSDPEFFFMKGGKVVPSSKVIKGGSIVVPDGFQGELNPLTDGCRQVSGNRICDALELANDFAERAGATLALRVGVDVDRETFFSLPADERAFGCSPTRNVYEKTKRPRGTRTRFRAGGGHVHLGGLGVLRLYQSKPKELIQLMDIVCGTLCVLVDRDPANIARRKYYGRAGEHRPKRYGVEYRVPSNFWLQSYTLWSMVSGLLRNAINIASDEQATKLVLDKINMKDVRDAINNNDKELAMKVFQQYKEIVVHNRFDFKGGLCYVNISQFEKWVNKADPISEVVEGDIENVLNSWEEHREFGDVPGLEWFLGDNY